MSINEFWENAIPQLIKEYIATEYTTIEANTVLEKQPHIFLKDYVFYHNSIQELANTMLHQNQTYDHLDNVWRPQNKILAEFREEMDNNITTINTYIADFEKKEKEKTNTKIRGILDNVIKQKDLLIELTNLFKRITITDQTNDQLQEILNKQQNITKKLFEQMRSLNDYFS